MCEQVEKIKREKAVLAEALRQISRRLNDSAGGGRTQKSRASLRKIAADALAQTGA